MEKYPISAVFIVAVYHTQELMKGCMLSLQPVYNPTFLDRMSMKSGYRE